jgi:metallo-beta-lactamase family protein
MRVTFHGAARTVTGSKHLVELENGARLLLDCGLFQGRRAEAEEKNRRLPFDARTIDAVLLSHAHIDHSGLLPRLYRDGFRGRIWATHATRSLAALMLLDSASIQERDTVFVNKIRARRDEPPVEPLYDPADAERVLELFTGISYRQPFSPLPEVTVEYRDAGHILGSATMVIEAREGGGTHRLGFTGDVGNPGRPIVRDPEAMADCDWLISESTYGGAVHDPPERTQDRLAEVIGGTAARGGKVIIPAFAVGKTQEVVYALDQLASRGRLPNVPIFVDSPLAVDATGVYLAHPECYDQELRRYLQSDLNPWSSRRITYVREVEASKRLNESRYPMVVLSASGMCEAGRVLHHLRHTVADPRHTVLIVGYCADHTLGKKLVDREPVVRIFGEEHARRCRVEVMNSLSAHADQPGLLAFLGRLDRDRLRRVFLVHGAPERQAALQAALESEGYRGVSIPAPGEAVTLRAEKDNEGADQRRGGSQSGA